MQDVRENWLKMPPRTRNIIKVIAAGTVAITLIAVIALNLSKNKDYGTLFTGLNAGEAQEVASLLQDEGIDYRYNGDGTIRVPAGQEDQARANLLSKGYPKSGFTYDMYLNNSGLMTTESDKKRVSLYELQERLGATIRVFDGVQDAKVTIAEGEGQKYALEDGVQQSASASAVITMKTGSTLTPDKAKAVKQLIAQAVRGMNFTNVSVFDAATMMEVGTQEEGSETGSAMDMTSLTTLVESNIAGNVRRVLEQLYGQGNVAVSVKGTLNMQRLIQESTQYSVPDKIDEQDKTGLLQREETSGESTTGANQAAGGVVGADANADTPRYTNNNGTEQIQENYTNGSAAREWLFNSLKEQREIDPGVLENTTVGVVINTADNQTVAERDLVNLVANSAGIPVDTAAQKITVIRAPKLADSVPAGQNDAAQATSLLPIYIALGAGGLLILLLVILLLLQRRKTRMAELAATAEEGFLPDDQLLEEGAEAGGEEITRESLAGSAAQLEEDAVEDEFNRSEEILNLRMQRSLRLKQNIAEFVDQNPQIAAKLIQSWLRGDSEEDGNGGNRKSNRKK
ncbi:MAG: flagellar M-ring protein FliF C-terminal domain-containing protein [Clostridiaceae bacterium]|uniref:Flagellar M-ring protein FliF n=1 Tax=Clostridium porci TaxID=2605778 RepID=A0A7X2TCW5_9CLOT|nr:MULTISPECIES: flagellar M-ring protein FliF C-terminal domain-containing protein [Clostridium]MCI6138804.1 flagellar M-ring protein FliF [Clostridium sp.]MDY3230451.1 flagellar M-ring protein FliF C-terminal domain-containing protein [Clostridiaceae bacterium]MSS37389.1 flagellar M-ring protein FliF [Clostridium porci]